MRTIKEIKDLMVVGSVWAVIDYDGAGKLNRIGEGVRIVKELKSTEVVFITRTATRGNKGSIKLGQPSTTHLAFPKVSEVEFFPDAVNKEFALKNTSGHVYKAFVLVAMPTEEIYENTDIIQQMVKSLEGEEGASANEQE